MRPLCVRLCPGVAVMALVSAPFVASRLILNLTPSMPIGLYLALDRRPVHGDLVLIEPPPRIRALAARRGYLSRQHLLLKIVAATTGDRVCRHGRAVSIGGRIRVWARRTDPAERALPVWYGCRVLRSGEIFVLGSHRASFDSRYFGPVIASDVVGVATPVWTFSSE